MHPNGKRLSTNCHLREKCSSANCELKHPICRLDKSCTNSKCGFSHTDGRRFTREQKKVPTVGDLLYEPDDQSQKLDFVQHSYSITDLKQIRQENSQPFQFSSSIKCADAVLQGTAGIKAAGRSVRAKGHVKFFDSTIKSASVQIFAPSVAVHSDFIVLLKQCDVVSLSLESSPLALSLREGDKVSFSLTVCANSESLFLASDPQLIKFAKRDNCDGLCDLVRLAVNEVYVDTALLDQILKLSYLNAEVVREIVIATHKLICLDRRIAGTKKLQALLLESDMFTLHGSVQKNFPELSDIYLLLRDLIGSLSVLNPSSSRLMTNIAVAVAQHLPAPSGLRFVSDMLVIATPLLRSDSVTHFNWWQLPSVPLIKELSCDKLGELEMLKSLPAVKVGESYLDMETYVSTYMRLHRADYFSDIAQKILQFRQSLGGGGEEYPHFSCSKLVVSGIRFHEGELLFQIDAVVANADLMSHDSLLVGNMIAISLSGKFGDESLVWGTVKAAPSLQSRLQLKQLQLQLQAPIMNSVPRISFLVQFCSAVNQIPDNSICSLLQDNHHRAALIESAISITSCITILDAMRNLWIPGKPLDLKFSASLLSGTRETAEDRDSFLETGQRLAIMSNMDEFQAAAYDDVSSHQFALIQGPPGTGKSFIGSRLGRIAAEECLGGRVLLVTSKNHALDELLMDIAKLFGADGLHKVVRVGRNRKINETLRPHTLQALNEKVYGGTAYSEMNKLSEKSKRTCNRLSNRIAVDMDTFLRATGEGGLRVLSAWYGVEWSGEAATKESMSALRHEANALLFSWSEAMVEEIKAQVRSRAVTVADTVQLSRVDEERFRHEKEKADEQEQYDLSLAGGGDDEEAAEFKLDSLLAVATYMGVGSADESFEAFIRSIDFSTPLTSSVDFVLWVLRSEFRTIQSLISSLAADLNDAQLDHAAASVANNINILRSVPVIGATILGAISNMEAIRATSPTTLLIEEAAEIPEASLIPLMQLASLKRCIMIGDHMQLRPPVNSYELQQQKRLDVSCFERMVLLGMHVPCLQNQSRMREDTLLPVLQHYPKLRTNTVRVRDLERLQWLLQPLFWWVCESPGVQKDSSWYNEEQGHRATQLASFLRTQGACEPSRITILVPYSSQQFFIRSLLRPLKMEMVTVSTVDQYQGDENDNIILCLVRCSPDHPEKLGFMGELNRMIVSTSRQRKSLTIIGSRTCFATNKDWKKLQDSLEIPNAAADDVHIHPSDTNTDTKVETSSNARFSDGARIGECIYIKCPRHSKVLGIPDSSVGFPRSGCGQGCQTTLSCGHPCSLKCHPSSSDHGFCKVPIMDVFKDCGHEFKVDCGNLGTNCCNKSVVSTLPCGHKAQAKCDAWTRKRESIACKELVTHTLLCGHPLVLKCGMNVDAYNNPMYSSCLSCQSTYLGGGDSLHDDVMPAVIQRIANEKASKSSSSSHFPSKKPNKTLWDWQITEVFLALCRLQLCNNADDSEVIREGIVRARVSEALFLSALPPSSAWDHNLSESERFNICQSFAEEQNLWRVVLQESGFNIPKAWIGQSLSLIACLAIFSYDGIAPHADQVTDVEVFMHRLSVVKEKKLSSQGLVTLIKQAGDELYGALAEHSDSDEWYFAEEGVLGRLILDRLRNCASYSLGDACLEQPGGVHKSFESVFHEAFDESHAEHPHITHLRQEWNLGARSSIYSPPYKEVPHTFIYQRSLAGRFYISLDLKSADFHVLHLAVPTLFNTAGTSWNEWVQSVIPVIVDQLPFIPDLKPLRVRVLGKVLHRKNVSMQSFCLRLIVRLLLVMAESYRAVFAFVSGIFHFSCDELIVQLREGCSPHDAHALAFEINSFVSSLKWDGWLPIRVELFELHLHTLPDQLVDDGELQVFDEERGVTRLYRGHPILRTSAQFVDLPSALDPAWEEPSLPALSEQESCPDGFFTRTVHSIHDHTAQKVQFKKLPNSFRPRVVMNHMKSKLQSKKKKDSRPTKSLSASAKEFTAAVPVAVAVAKSGSLSTTAQAFVPGLATTTPSYSRSDHAAVRVDGRTTISTSAAMVKDRGLQVAEVYRPVEQSDARLSLSHTAMEFVPTVFSSSTADGDSHASSAVVGLSSAAPEFVPSFYVLDEPMVDSSRSTLLADCAPTLLTGFTGRDGYGDVDDRGNYRYSAALEPDALSYWSNSSSLVGDGEGAGETSGESLKLSGAAPAFVPATYMGW